MRRRMLYKVVAPIFVGAMLAVAVPGSPAYATSGIQCHASSDYGTTCINVIGSKLSVGDVFGYYTTPTNNFLSNHYWRFELTKYACSPYGNTKSQCPPNAHYYSGARHGQPPVGGTICQSISAGNGAVSYTYQQCSDYGEAEVVASHGDISGFSVPKTFSTSPTYLCMEIQVQVNGVYKDNGTAGSAGQRGCATVHT